MDHDHALAERLYVGHVVAGQHNRGAAAAVVLGEKGSDAALHGHVQADRGLV